jgi:hypothetical protein
MIGTALAANLLGAIVGGVIEYTALITGYRFLLIVVGALYALAFVSSRFLRRPALVPSWPSAALTSSRYRALGTPAAGGTNSPLGHQAQPPQPPQQDRKAGIPTSREISPQRDFGYWRTSLPRPG